MMYPMQNNVNTMTKLYIKNYTYNTRYNVG